MQGFDAAKAKTSDHALSGSLHLCMLHFALDLGCGLFYRKQKRTVT